MLRWMLAVGIAGTWNCAFAQEIEPGEWQFTSTVSTPMFPKPQTNTVKHCVEQEDAGDPGKWSGDKGASDCKSTLTQRAGDTFAWEMTCPKAGMRATGSVLIGRGTVESESRMTMQVQGQKMEMQTRMKGKRLGPCKP